MQADHDVLIVGAGAAGLSAAVELSRAGMNVAIVEARARVGGRMYTVQDPATDAAVELGAEFIHGLAPEIWEVAQREKIPIFELEGENWCERHGKMSECVSMPEVDKVFRRLERRNPDESFLEFMERWCPDLSEAGKRWAMGYISGFHAADPALISVNSLVFGMSADEKIEGDRSFRMRGGYHALIDVFERQLAAAKVAIYLNTTVKEVQWSKGQVSVATEEGTVYKTLVASRVLLTLPLGVLQANEGEEGVVRFSPSLPAEKQRALGHLAMGKVARITLRFDERFWEGIRPSAEAQSLADASFFFTQEDWFPTWWTTMPLRLPIITAWSPSTWAKRLAGQSEEFITDKALAALQSITGTGRQELESRLQASYWHDWESDAFSRGAYSYVKVGGGTAQAELGRPLENTVFFAGEATDVSGHNGTVHGAIASGQRAAREILQSR
jgi:monoamine oxidase